MGAGLLAVVGVLVAVYVKGVVAGGPGSVAPTPQTHAYSVSQTLQYVPAPFIAAPEAVQIALRGTEATTQVLDARLESVSEAQAELGFRPAPLFVASARMVWVVTLKGTYVQSSCSPSGGCLPALADQTYYVVIDAATGNVFATGIFNAAIGH